MDYKQYKNIKNKVNESWKIFREIYCICKWDVWQLVVGCWLLVFLIGLFEKLEMLVVFIDF